MPFQKGREKSGGRKVGSPNKTTAEIREKIQMVLSGKVDELSDDLKEMNAFKQWQILTGVSKFVLPALNRNDDTLNVSGGYNITVSFEDSSTPERDNDSEESPF